MRRQPISLDLKFPFLIAGIVLVTSTVFVWSAYRQFAGVLHDNSGARLQSSATLLAGAIAEGVSGTRAQVGRITASEVVRHFLRTGEDSALVRETLAELLPSTPDPSRIHVRLLDREGIERYAYGVGNVPPAPNWADGAAERGALSPTGLSFSPILEMNGSTQFEVVAPVHSRPDGESLVGYVAETRVIRARGADVFRRLIGTSTMLFGQPDAGVWSDLEQVVPGPPAIPRVDSVIVFDDSPRGPGIGVAQAIAGTPWIVWLELSRGQVLAPVRTFVERIVPITLLVAALGAIFAWLFSRRITNRIVRLTAEVDRMDATERPTAPRADDGRDELDRLEESFRLMSARAQKQQQLESQLMQSQKLEAVGRLAGGIAHDFNNMLTVVSNYGEMVQAELEPGSPAARDMDEILHATTHAAHLTRQLLAFSRRQILQPVRLDLNDVIRGAHRMLERVIPSHIEFRHDLDDSISAVHADPGQIEQVLMNLALNASDAMPQGGRLTFRTTSAELDEIGDPDDAKPARARRHVCLIVMDTGVGMDRDTAARIFEPFFTTKSGKGTGLGLASVHGIITQLGGSIWVYSKPGKGTTFKIYFPEVDGPAEPLAGPVARDTIQRGAGTLILLVEDDPATREVTRRLLTRHGYDVTVAGHGAEAIALLARGDMGVRLVISDVMMPEISGLELASQVTDRWPELPVLLMSGYSDAEVYANTDLARRPALIEKPFTSTALLSAVARALHEDGRAPAGVR